MKLERIHNSRPDALGMLGGTFNPIHYGHLRIAEKVQKVLGLKEIIFVPSARPPHKSESGLPSPKDRYEMVKLAIAKYPFFSISDIELKRRGKSWTIDTVRTFKKFYPKFKIYFIIGADTLSEIPTWKDYKKLLKICRFVVINRPGYSIKVSKMLNIIGNFIKVKIPGINISSTEIRKRIKDRESIKKLVPEDVEKYIENKRLYRTGEIGG